MNKIYLIGIIIIFGSILTIAGINLSELAYAQGNPSLTATLSGKEVVPPVETGGTGVANFEVSDNSISYQINVLNAGKITSVEIHKGAAGTNGEAIAIVFKPKNSSGNLLGDLPKIGDCKICQSFQIFLQQHKNLAHFLLVGILMSHL